MIFTRRFGALAARPDFRDLLEVEESPVRELTASDIDLMTDDYLDSEPAA